MTYFCATEVIGAIIAQDEQRAAFLNTAKAAIEAEHLSLVRRVFRALPDPLPEAAAIRAAFRADPEYKTLAGRNADQVMKLIIARCRYNGWRIPEALKDLEHWGTLFVKWHWFCSDRLRLVGPDSLPQQWAGLSKALVEKAHPLLQPPKKRKPSRNYWFDHAPFRMMFGNQTCGMSWLKDAFAASRAFLLLDGDSICVGIVPRDSRFCPYTLPDAQPGDGAYLLYEETQGEPPRLRAVPKARIDVPAGKGLVLLFTLDGKAKRSKSNLNALYLRALFSPENMRDGIIHLDGNAEFHVRKGTDIPRDGKPDHFRQRFTEDRFFVTLRLTFNAQMVATGAQSQAFGNLADSLAANPDVKLISVESRQDAASSKLIGDLVRRVIAEDACVLFAPGTSRLLLKAAREKFEYAVLKDRPLTADGGALRGYQLADRLFVGRLDDAKRQAKEKTEARTRHEAEAAACAARAAQRAENRAKAELGRKRAILSKGCLSPNFGAPVFKEGAILFKVEYRTADNVHHEAKCRADSRDEMYQKAKSIGVRLSRVTELRDA